MIDVGTCEHCGASFMDENNVIMNSGHLIAEYRATFPLTTTEFELLYEMISETLCQLYFMISKEAQSVLKMNILKAF